MCFRWGGAFVLAALWTCLAGPPTAKPDPSPAPTPAPIVTAPDTNGWVHLRLAGESPDTVFTIKAATNLQQWLPIATLHNAPFDFADPGASQLSRRFYIVNSAPRSDVDDWKNQVATTEDPFTSRGGAEEVRWIKFIIPAAEPNRVYFQDSGGYLFHYDFAAARLPQFKGMTRQAFDAATLRLTSQQAVLGAVLLPPFGANTVEYGIQFVGLDPFPRESVARWFDVVRSAVAAPEGARALYMPTYEQAAVAQADEPYFRSRGIALGSVDQWTTGDICYSTGWALGRLVYVPSAQIDAAYADGRLRPDDILLTDATPAEIPFVAAVVTMKPSTPNSHVAILARSHGLPFVYIARASERERIQGLVGKDVLLRVGGPADACQTEAMAVGSDLPPSLRAEILDLKRPPELAIVPKAAFGALSAPVDGLVPADIKYFGGKASNFGSLRRKIPDHSPAAVAFSFDLWDSFLNQALPSGKTLAQEISSRLGKYSYPPNIAALRDDLAAVRDLITSDAAVFTPAQQQAILNAVSIFPPQTKVRFRSSTNVEDSEQFSGAGLYDSYSGCPADDLDADTDGPSACDPDESKERGVFRAMKKVYASFYNENAFLERLRFGVDESQVGMAVLAHVSTPDEIEMANGVATLRLNGDGVQGELVTQAGALSVTNPDGSAQPEVVTVSKFSFGTFLDVKQRSSLVQLGGTVLVWESEYRSMVDLLLAVADEYRARGTTNAVLDFEYKKIAPGALSVKQVRQVPAPAPREDGAPYLLNEPGAYCVFQGEFGDVFSNHRLKSRWAMASCNLRLVAPNLASSIYTNTAVELLDGAQRFVLTNGTAGWPEASHTVSGARLADRWKLGQGTDERVFKLETDVSADALTQRGPVIALGDLRPTLSVTYATAQPTLDFEFAPARTTNEVVRLWSCPAVTEGSLRQQRTIQRSSLVINTSYYWPPPPSGFTAGYTAPLQAWAETRISGLTSEPIVLRGEYSQTYRPEHHNFAENFIFEPRLEEGLSQGQLQELSAANIRLLHVFYNEGASRITILGLDGNFRALP